MIDGFAQRDQYRTICPVDNRVCPGVHRKQELMVCVDGLPTNLGRIS